MPLLNIYKPLYVTPLQVVDSLRVQFPEYKEAKIGYAGRLDPLAHGVLLLMVGEETKQREKHLDLPKTYEFEALLGLETDSYDVLGLLADSTSQMDHGSLRATRYAPQAIKKFLNNKLGTHTQSYPPFSSKAVHGKPLHWWAKQNKLSEIPIPTREITIDTFDLLATGSISAGDLEKKIIKSVTSVQGHFRQKETLETWNNYFNSQSAISNQKFTTARFRITCSSGTYVRGLIHELGEVLGTGALALEILRTKVGDYSIDDSLRI
jgi:tRNA pseudouridine55 synthase